MYCSFVPCVHIYAGLSLSVGVLFSSHFKSMYDADGSFETDLYCYWKWRRSGRWWWVTVGGETDNRVPPPSNSTDSIRLLWKLYQPTLNIRKPSGDSWPISGSGFYGDFQLYEITRSSQELILLFGTKHPPLVSTSIKHLTLCIIPWWLT